MGAVQASEDATCACQHVHACRAKLLVRAQLISKARPFLHAQHGLCLPCWTGFEPAADMSSTPFVRGFHGNRAKIQKNTLPMPLLVKKMVGEYGMPMDASA